MPHRPRKRKRADKMVLPYPVHVKRPKQFKLLSGAWEPLVSVQTRKNHWGLGVVEVRANLHSRTWTLYLTLVVEKEVGLESAEKETSLGTG